MNILICKNDEFSESVKEIISLLDNNGSEYEFKLLDIAEIEDYEKALEMIENCEKILNL